MKTYLFDFDGTLVDSMPTYVSVMLRILDETGTPYDKSIVKIITPLGFKDTARYFVNIGVPLSYDEIVERMGLYAIDEYLYNIEAKPGVTDTLMELKKSGYSLNVLTASPHVTLDPCLKRLGLFDLFDNVWSCNDFDTNKSDPGIYLQAAERLGVPISDVIFLDDNTEADRAAVAAGAVVVGVYDPSSAEYEEEMRAITHAYIRDFSELLSLKL